MNHHLVLAFVAALTTGALLPGQEPKPDAGQPGQPSHAPLPPDGGKLQPINPQSGNAWFPVTEVDLGTHFGHEEAVGTFKFKNPRAEAVQWRSLLGSCSCARAVIRVGDRRYELLSKPQKRLVRINKGKTGVEAQEDVQVITVEAGEQGEVEVHMEMHGVTGPRQATLDVHTSDAALPQLRLKWQATGAQMFVVSPAEVNLNKMTWNESREFTVTVTSPLKKDFNIKRMDDAGKAFAVTWEKAMNGDNAVWTIKGKYGPVDGETGGGGVLKFYSDIQGDSSFLVRVMAFVQGPLEIKPGTFLPLGQIRKGTGLKKEVVFEANDGTQLEALKLAFEKLSLGGEFVSAAQRLDHGKLIVELAVSEKAPPGLLKGELVVELNHALVKEKRIMFNGFVR